MQDRGTMKWTSLMLPEHTKLLAEWKEHYNQKTPRKLEQWELEELQQLIMQAQYSESSLLITVFKNGQFEHITGTINKIIQQRATIVISQGAEEIYVPFESIVAAQLEGIIYD